MARPLIIQNAGKRATPQPPTVALLANMGGIRVLWFSGINVG